MILRLYRPAISPCRVQGFTLIELITILVLIGVMAAVALPRFADRRAFESKGFTDQVLSALRFAQKSAVAERRRMQVVIAAGSVTVNVCTVAAGADACTANMSACGTALTLPAGGNAIAAPSGVTLTPHTFRYDCLGRPVSDANSGWVDVATTDITVTASGEANRTVRIEGETGYVREL